MNNFSIIIVTYGRKGELEKLLFSINSQDQKSFLDEVIIVDNHPKNIGKSVIDSFLGNIKIKYIKNSINSLTAGRSLGSQASNSDVVLFLDDDVILKKNYFQNLIKFYKNNPHANGMQGYFHVGSYSKLKNKFNKVFWLFNYSHNQFKVYPSIQASYSGKVPDQIIECEWFSGTNFSYRREVIRKIPFDLNLVKYCEGEDIDYSYRVFKEFGNIYINPLCRIEHTAAMTSREIGEEFAIMQEIYGIYLLNKLFPNSAASKFKFFISRVGKLILFLIDIIRFQPHALKNLVVYLKSLKISLLDRDLDKFNKNILKQ